jgi:hypothetical protein
VIGGLRCANPPYKLDARLHANDELELSFRPSAGGLALGVRAGISVHTADRWHHGAKPRLGDYWIPACACADMTAAIFAWVHARLRGHNSDVLHFFTNSASEHPAITELENWRGGT